MKYVPGPRQAKAEIPKAIYRPQMRRRGHFTVSRAMLRETPLEEMSRIMEGVVVWHCDANLFHDTITYSAECEDFEPVEEGREPPSYSLHVITDEGVFSHREFRKI